MTAFAARWPRSSGAPLASVLREWYPWLKVLVISGYTDVATLVCDTLLPGTPVLAKPFKGVELERAVRNVLSGIP